MPTLRDQTVAELERIARRLVTEDAPAGEAVVELQRISPDPLLLGEAAGRALGGWEANPLYNATGRDVAALLVRAGSDAETMQQTADETARRLREHLTRG